MKESNTLAMCRKAAKRNGCLYLLKRIPCLFPFLAFAASRFPSEQGSAQCVDPGTHIAVTETQPVRGASGTIAVLKVSTSDDHGRNSHLCNTEYQLLIMPAAGSAPVEADLLTANDDYGRSLSLRLDGFTQDDSQILGILSESGKRTATFLFEYEITNGNAQLVDLTHEFARIQTAS